MLLQLRTRRHRNGHLCPETSHFGRDQIQSLGFDGVLKSANSLTLDERFEPAAVDRDFWFQNGTPEEVLGQRVFEPLREKARRTVDFHSYHPLMFEFLGGQHDLLWVRRTPYGRDQV